MAVAAMRVLQASDRQVPTDVSVVGFDDVPEAGYLIPPLTTVRQDFPAVGRRAIEVIRTALTGGPLTPSPLLAPTLVVRASTAPPPGTGTT